MDDAAKIRELLCECGKVRGHETPCEESFGNAERGRAGATLMPNRPGHAQGVMPSGEAAEATNPPVCFPNRDIGEIRLRLALQHCVDYLRAQAEREGYRSWPLRYAERVMREVRS